MNNSFFNKSLLILISFVFFIFFAFSIFSYNFKTIDVNTIDFYYSYNYNKFIWPLPNNSYVSSYFGYRKAPTQGASTYHSGIDIPAVEGTNILAICSGRVSYVGFSGAGGYAVTIVSDNFTISYCHLSSDFLVYENEYINQGKIIGTIGPKYIDSVLDNPYKDSSGKSTNGATTGPHLHLSIKKDGVAVNPLNYMSSSSSL